MTLILGLAGPGWSQFNPELLSRAKAVGVFDGSFANLDITGWQRMSYPGFLDGPYNFWEGNQHGIVVYATKNGQAITFVNYAKKFESIEPVIDVQLHKNYNFSESPDKPEEYITATSQIPEYPLEIESERMAWSLPKYDDFILVRIKLTNTGTDALQDLYFARNVPWEQAHGFNNDQKFMWLEEEKAFVFYDDRSFSWNSEEETYFEYGPGPVTGDAGDPVDIQVPNAVKHELMSPTLYSCVGMVVPPAKNGQDALNYNIVHTDNNHEIDSGVPDYEQKPQNTDNANDILRKLTHIQPRMSWDEASADASTQDGNKYERKPFEVISFGPYDLAAGESVEIVYAFIFGQTTRERIVQGGVDVTSTFVQEGLVEWKKNYAAAMELIENNYRPTAYPPPTVGEKGDNLLVEAVPGFNQISFEPIPSSYTDPLSGSNDLAGYKVYRSNYSRIGPWEVLADLSVSEASSMMQDGMVVVQDETVTLGVGYYYTVSSYDTEGLESAAIAYNRYGVFPQRAPGTADATGTYVVPNPFRVINRLIDSSEWNRISFVNVPAQCTIRIYTVAGDLVRELEHDDGSGEKSWGSNATLDLQATRYWKYPSPGVYVYQVESRVPGHEGEKFVGKLAIIR